MSVREPAETLVFLCECGPIISGLVDLEAVERDLASAAGVAAVTRHATLCSEEGRAWMAEKLAEHAGALPVVAACSPREHAASFATVCRDAGVNPYLLARANLREQCGWVTPDREEATGKALAAIHAALARVRRQAPLEETEVDCNTDVLVIGAGVAGMTAARMLADAGRKVVLVERTAAIGGKVVLYGEAFPELECASCMLEPLMDETMHHPNIEVLTSAEVEDVLGYFGHFTARVLKRPRHVEVDNCFACRTCEGACPVETSDPDVDAGLGTRKAVGIPYAGALPNASAIDESACLRFNGSECSACADSCPFGAIDLGAEPETLEREIGAIVVATGLGLADGGSAFAAPPVMTTYAFERMLNPDGPTGGELRTPGSDGAAPTAFALVHCADEDACVPAASCSRVCCLSLAKCAHEIAARVPDARIVDVVRERTAGGKGYREFLDEVAAQVEEYRVGPADIARVAATDTGGAVVRVTRADGAVEEIPVDIAVVAPPLVGARGVRDLAGVLGIDTDDEGFFLEEHRRLRSFSSRVEGVFVAGTANGPKDVQETASHAAGAAGAVLSALVPGRKLRRDPSTAAVDPSLCGGCRLCVAACPYKAVTFDLERRAAEVNELLCRGCGTCAAACPSSAIAARNFTDAELLAEIRSYAEPVPRIPMHGRDGS